MGQKKKLKKRLVQDIVDIMPDLKPKKVRKIFEAMAECQPGYLDQFINEKNKTDVAQA